MTGGVVWSDDFTSGFPSGWSSHEEGDFRPADAVVTIGDGLTVKAKGVNPDSGEPAFTQTMPQVPPDAPHPGVLDHVKWVASVDHQSSGGFTGFDTPSGKAIHVEALLGGRTYGTARHPFGAAVRDAESDFRLGAAALVAMDAESNIVFNFFLTNTEIFAMYERAPFARDTFGDYAAFSFAVPVGSRTPDDWHRLAVSYDRDSGVARWFADGELVFEITRVGHRIDRRYLAIDVGGDDQLARVNQLQCGLGMFTLMDASLDGGPGLVDLYGYPMFFDPKRGAPHPQRYVDTESRPESRLFGQGAEIRCKSFTVSHRGS
ncbi:DUF6081 family protein [Amycolatopsis jejuensis]|uniref:DUF6081 family protein n=1 Tax=Amycolatopsis jejuensis TaxID=330084 RepID=UPI000527458A|nr:DUF6081 family protein [Amycolatopsis jejuensis]